MSVRRRFKSIRGNPVIGDFVRESGEVGRWLAESLRSFAPGQPRAAVPTRAFTGLAANSRTLTCSDQKNFAIWATPPRFIPSWWRWS